MTFKDILNLLISYDESKINNFNFNFNILHIVINQVDITVVYYSVVWLFFQFYGQKLDPLVFYFFGPLDSVLGPSPLYLFSVSNLYFTKTKMKT